ncbi:MAG: LysR family transcriptional regulator [Rhodospirillum sp.]|nr:LysR family transcriptional regulator [Rhodospirillum sp.]MCF8488474.1 LysR family transcriptional regulator [Rhodospirillum sp.]MCF8502378.1 LysR family transcriptional regulator [Rhodospirillum sp.]
MILPPLTALRAFEACATIGTFRGAADRLNVTPSAISHQIRQLEEVLGVALFERSTRRVRLTAAGEGYLPSVREALRLIEAATASLTRHADQRRLTVSAAPSHAMGWLMPRIPRFQMTYPEVELRLDMSIDWVDLRATDVDVALRYSASGHFPGLIAHHLFDEVIVPVCRPDLFAEGDSGPEALLALPLVEVSYRSGQWSHWCLAAGVEDPAPDPGLVVDYDTVAVEAALDGLGVALVPRALVTRHVAIGRLRIPFPVRLEGVHGACHLVYPAERRDDPDIARFHAWLKAELARED